MFHIEFMGLPGAGKSIIKNRLLYGVKKKGIRCFSMEEGLLYSYRRMDCNELYQNILKILPSAFSKRFIMPIFRRSKCRLSAQDRFLTGQDRINEFLIKFEALKDKLKSEKELVIPWFLEIASLYQMIKEQIEADVPVFFDEGFIQISMSLLLSPTNITKNYSNENLLKYLNLVPIPDLLIFIETDISRCIERMESRPRGLTQRLKTSDKESVEAFLSLCQDYFGEIAQWMKKNNRATIRINNNGYLEDTVKSLLDEYLNFLKM